ncbi:MAG TPA: hypothetical protein PK659_09720 [Methanothrix sp.]|nr:hypothetical protein [Methanothrix sp.]HOL44518.1 hypothetical protein [Methanothrix sp.]
MNPVTAQGVAHNDAFMSGYVAAMQKLTENFWGTQREILEAIRKHPRVAVRSAHGVGKTYTVARIALWWLCSYPDSIVLTTAPTWRQVTDLIWKEIRYAFYEAGLDRLFPEADLAPVAPSLMLQGKNWMAMGISTNDPNRFQGYHSEHLLVIADEAAGVSDDIFEAIEGVLTSAHCRLVLIGNPTAIGGQFYRAFRTPGWKTFHIPAWETPNFTETGITRDDIIHNRWMEKAPRDSRGNIKWPHPYLVTPQWCYDRFVEWGDQHPAWFARVEAEFPDQSDVNVIPLAWIEQAQRRRYSEQELSGHGRVFGVDVARTGSDLSVVLCRRGPVIEWLKTFAGMDTQELAGHVVSLARQYKPECIAVDVIGIGAGVVDALRQFEPAIRDAVQEVNVASASETKDGSGNRVYQNLRAELWWEARMRFDPKHPQPFAIPPHDDMLMSDLATPQYSLSKGWIQIEPKEDTKKRIGRSPDRGDALILSLITDVAERKQERRIKYRADIKLAKIGGLNFQYGAKPSPAERHGYIL